MRRPEKSAIFRQNLPSGGGACGDRPRPGVVVMTELCASQQPQARTNMDDETQTITKPNPPLGWWDKHQTAAHLRVSPRQVLKLAEKGDLPAYQLPGMRGFRFRAEEVDPPYGLPAQAATQRGQFWTPIGGQFSTPIDTSYTSVQI